ncbi:hypothetical protein PGT21_017617 [Puccinia graminis f. sp. tritici]|uniref:Uncharacterized protein n=1 Tax=Puccinia graminis f. sp. tritici TaxID=56615 RepID=A0A5B0PY26_PUCGR|nr:hypothetical protein PGT21_017617 [Puccinia graminis f. sp. tritici]
MTTEEVKEIFRGPKNGVTKKDGMNEVSAIWNGLSDEQKAAYRKKAHPAPASPPDSTEAETVKTSDNVNDEEVAMRQTISFKRAANQVVEFMNNWVAQAVHLAKSANCELVMFAVSRHLGNHAFQFAKCTHGATRFVTGAQILDGTKHYAARMQSYLTGYEVAQIAKINGKKPRLPNKHPVTIAARMRAFIREKTEGALNKWPWTKTNYRLAQAKFRLELLPGARSKRESLMRPSRYLKSSPESTLHRYLDQNTDEEESDPGDESNVSERSIEDDSDEDDEDEDNEDEDEVDENDQ